MKGKVAKKFLAVASAVVLAVSGVAGDYCTAYAAVAPSIEVGEGLSYLFEMLSSALGASVSKAAVPSLYLAVDAYSKTSDPAYMAQLREYYEDDALVRSEPIDTGFCNWLLGAIKDVFVSSGDYATDATEYAVPVYGDATYFEVATTFEVFKNSTKWKIVAPPDTYFLPIAGEKGYNAASNNAASNNPSPGVGLYLVSDSPFDVRSDSKIYSASYSYFFGAYSYVYSINGASGEVSELVKIYDIPYPWVSFPYNPVASDTVDVSIYIDKALAAIQAQALVKTPAITAPISIPSDAAAMEENAKAVAAADDADALYKALAAAGIAIDIGIDVPDETDKPTDAEIPDDNTGAIGKSLADILAAITGLADKVATIPGAIADFFTPDMAAIAEAADNVQETFLKQFGGITQLAGIFKRSYEFGMEVPVFTMPVPDPLKYAYPDTDEIVVLDLRPYTTQLFWARGILTAVIWVLFAKWLLDQFDVKLHVG